MSQLADIVSSSLQPFRIADIRVRKGPDVAVPSTAILPFTLVFHELATNAMKHGALTQEGRKVSISWTVKDAEVEMNWNYLPTGLEASIRSARMEDEGNST